eukprot:gene14393-20395_t
MSATIVPQSGPTPETPLSTRGADGTSPGADSAATTTSPVTSSSSSSSSRPTGTTTTTTSTSTKKIPVSPSSKSQRSAITKKGSPSFSDKKVQIVAAAVATGAVAITGLAAIVMRSIFKKPKAEATGSTSASLKGPLLGDEILIQAPAPGLNPHPSPCSGMKSTSKCVPLADGSACVVRRTIPADNSCLFNAIGYSMHHSKSKATFLREVVAREVASDPDSYSTAFLGMSNDEYCGWITQRHTWGGGIELAILAKHYGREINAWNIEAIKGHVFGEESGKFRVKRLGFTQGHVFG